MVSFPTLINGHKNIVLYKTFAFQRIWWAIAIEWSLLAHFWKSTQYTPTVQIDTGQGASNVVWRLVVGRDWPVGSKRLPSTHNGCRLTTGSSAYARPAKRQLCQRRLPLCIPTYFLPSPLNCKPISTLIFLHFVSRMRFTKVAYIVYLQYPYELHILHRTWSSVSWLQQVYYCYWSER